MPRVTVIVPNYNHEKFLRQRLESVLGQTFADFEVLLLDDASTDASLEVFRPYAADPRVRVLLNDVNSGSPFKQWNRGLDAAAGDYIWIAESDDFAEADFLQDLVAVLDADPNVGIAYCQSRIVHMDDSDIEPGRVKAWYATFEDKERWEKGYRNSGRAELANYMVYKNTIPNASAVLFRRSLLNDGLRAPENMRLAGDWMFWARILCRTDLVFLAKPLNYFRVAHSHSQRSKTAQHGLELMEGLDVYAFIEGTALLDLAIKAEVLKQQVKLWGSIAYFRRLTWNTNRNIYRKLLAVHPEVIAKSIKSILLPFAYHFLAAPIRRIRPLVRGKRRIKGFLRSCNKAKRKLKVWATRFKVIARAAMSRTWLLGMLYVSFCKRFPVDSQVVMLESHHGLEFFGNPYYVARHLVQFPRYKYLRIVVVCPRRSVGKLRCAFAPAPVRFCRVRSIRYAFFLATAGYLVNESTFPLYFCRREGQQCLNTWHGTPLKALGRKSAQGHLEFVSNPQRNLLHATELLAPNRHTERVLLQDYMIENIWRGKVLRCGYPRNDALFKSHGTVAHSEKSRVNVAFMPTWRAKSAKFDEASSAQLTELRALFGYLDKTLPGNVTVWVRLHPMLRGVIRLKRYQRLRPFPSDIEPYEHLATCDALVTDYSSVLFDFASTRRPIFLYTPDADAYHEERDFCLDIEALPFPKLTTPEALATALSGLAKESTACSEAREKFINEFCSLDQGRSTEALCAKYFLAEQGLEIREIVPDRARKNLLIFCGSLQNNGITAALKTLVSLIDKHRYNVTLWFDVEPAKKNAGDYFQRLDGVVAYIPTQSELMVSPIEGVRLLFREFTGSRWVSNGYFDQELWKREWKRLFGAAHFDTVVHFSGYERRVSYLLSICPARRVVFVHNEMVEEVEKKGVDGGALETVYQKADVIALVREGLDKKYNSRVADISSKAMFVPNTLKTNYLDLCHAPLSDSLSPDRDQMAISKLERLMGQEDAFRFVNLARFAVEKGQKRLIEAFERVWADNSSCQLFMLGGYGPIYKQLCRRARSSPASGAIFIALGSDNPYPLVARMDTMVLASYYEGRPLVLYEAFALGLSVLSTDIPGPAEILNQGYGLVVENSVDGLVAGMQAALRGEIPQRPYDFEAHNRFALGQFYKAVGA